MEKFKNLTVIMVGLIFIISIGANLPIKTTPYKISFPNTWPSPTYDFDKNPLTEESIRLGRALFYDGILSKDGSINCSNCHLSYTAFTHVDHDLSHGIGDSIGNRNSMTLMNLAWSKSFMWDGAINHLDMQALAPISDPKEMGEEIGNVIKKLEATEKYPLLFESAYGSPEITSVKLLKSLSQFQLTMISSKSKYDKVIAGEAEFDTKEANGYKLFKANCNNCHTEPLFTNGNFENNGLAPDKELYDLGRYNVTLNSLDSFKFKVPSLRNIEFSKPYMHDGRFRSLKKVINHYTNSMHQSTTLSPILHKPIALSNNEKVDLLAFLKSLTDHSFLFNKALAFPMK